MAWSFINAGTEAEANGGNLTLTEPASAASGDLIVAVIAIRDAAAFTVPTDWDTSVVLNTGNASVSNGSNDADAGILIAWIVRGGSAPSYVFTRTSGNIARGNTFCFRSNAGGVITPGPTSNAFPNTNAGSITVPGITTSQNNTLLIFGCANSQDTAAFSGWAAATDPTSASWSERMDVATTTGADVRAGAASAVKTTAGATGDFTVSASANGGLTAAVASFYEDAPPITVANWYRNLEQPTFLKTFVFAQTAPFLAKEEVEEEEEASVSSWFPPLSVPSRAKLARHAAAVLAATTGAVFTPVPPPAAEATSVDKYHQPLSQPARRPGLPVSEQQALAYVRVILSDPVTPIDWFQSIAPPAPRARRAPPTEPFAFVKAAPFEETPQLDKWHQPLAQPTRRKKRAPESGLAYVAVVQESQALPDIGWLVNLVQPRKPSIEVSSATAAFVAIGAGPTEVDPGTMTWFQPLSPPYRDAGFEPSEVNTGFVVDVPTVDEWWRQLSEPKRVKRLSTAQQQSIGFVQVVEAQAETVTVDKWHRPLATPAPRRNVARFQQALAFVQAAPFAEATTVDRWHQPLSTPVRRKQTHPPGASAFSPFISAGNGVGIEWFRPLDRPALKPLAARSTGLFSTPFVLQQGGDGVGTIGWFSHLVQPTRRILFRQPADPVLLYVEPAPPAPSFDWRVDLHQPPRRKARAPLGGTVAPATVPTLPYAWAVALSQPVRLKAALARGDSLAVPVLVPAPAAPPSFDWLRPLSEPVRRRTSAKATAFAEPVHTPAETPALPGFGWFAPLGSPQKAAPRPTGAPSFGFVELRPLPGFEWFSPLGEPPKPRVTLKTALQSSVAFQRLPDDPPIAYRRIVELTGSVDRLRELTGSVASVGLLGSVDRLKPLAGTTD